MGKRAGHKIGVLLVLLFLQLHAGRGEAFEFEVKPLEKTYDVRILFSTNTIRGRYYRPEPDTGKPLLVLIHGATYGKWMWDVPGYSWIDFLSRGTATRFWRSIGWDTALRAVRTALF